MDGSFLISMRDASDSLHVLVTPARPTHEEEEEEDWHSLADQNERNERVRERCFFAPALEIFQRGGGRINMQNERARKSTSNSFNEVRKNSFFLSASM